MSFDMSLIRLQAADEPKVVELPLHVDITKHSTPSFSTSLTYMIVIQRINIRAHAFKRRITITVRHL